MTTQTSSMTDTTYNGWTNYETWNVALYINNEFPIYSLARDWVQDRIMMGYDSLSYEIFQYTLKECIGQKTPDGVRYDDPKLDIQELTEMLQELA